LLFLEIPVANLAAAGLRRVTSAGVSCCLRRSGVD